MQQKSMISDKEYRLYLEESSKISIVKFVLIFLPLIILFILGDIIDVKVNSFIVHIITFILAISVCLLYLNLNSRNNINRDINSRLHTEEIKKRFDGDCIFSVPVTQKYFTDDLPGTLYFTHDKITFIANRIIGLKLVWFNLNKLLRGYYDLNFLPQSFPTKIVLKNQSFPLSFILKNPSKKLVITEKRLNFTKIYSFKIPTTIGVLEALKDSNKVVFT